MTTNKFQALELKMHFDVEYLKNQCQFYCPLKDSTFLFEQGDDIISSGHKFWAALSLHFYSYVCHTPYSVHAMTDPKLRELVYAMAFAAVGHNLLSGMY